MMRTNGLAVGSIVAALALAGCASDSVARRGGAGARGPDAVPSAEPASLLGERSYVECEYLPPVPAPRRPRGPDDRTFTFRVVEDPYLAQGYVIVAHDRYGNPLYAPAWTAYPRAPWRRAPALCHHCGRNPCACAPVECPPDSCDVPRAKLPVGVAQPIAAQVHAIAPHADHVEPCHETVTAPCAPPDVDAFFRLDARAR